MNQAVTHALQNSRLGQRLIRGSVTRAVQRALPPRLKIALQFYYHFGYLPNLRHPTTYSEKIQHRKLHDRDPRLAPLIDKIAAKDLVADVIDANWIIPTLWSGADPAHIPFDSLTPPYVVKANHASNCNLFVLDAETLDPGAIRAEAARWLKINHARYAHEWAYSQVEPALLIEPYIGETTSRPVDLKFLVFHGKVHHIEVCVERDAKDMRWIAFDRDWFWQPILRTGRFEQADKALKPPQNLAAMIEAAEALAAPFSFVRVDFYEVAGRPLFGEMTFYPDAGYSAEYSTEFDRELGERWRL